MDENVDVRVLEFLKSHMNPDEDDIRNFVDSLSSEFSSLDTDALVSEIKARSEVLQQQSTRLYRLEEDFSNFSDSPLPETEEFKTLLSECFEKNSDLEDISEQLERLDELIQVLKNSGENEEELEIGDTQDVEVAPQINNLLERIQRLKSQNADIVEKSPERIEKQNEIEDEVIEKQFTKSLEDELEEEMQITAPEDDLEQPVEEEEEVVFETTSESFELSEEATQEEQSEENISDDDSFNEEISLDSGYETEEFGSTGLMNKLGGGKQQLSSMLKEKIDERGETFAREAATGEPVSERQLVVDIMEERLVSDVEARIKKLKEQQQWAMEEKKPTSVVERVKNYFAKEDEEIEDYDPDVHGPLVTFEGLDKYEEIERYWVNEPYAFVVILNNTEKKERLYYVVEPKLTPFEDIFLREIKDRLRDVLLVEDIIIEEEKDMVLTNKVKELVKDYVIDLSPPLLEKILYYVKRDFINFGPIDALQNDDRLEDISCNGHNVPVYLYHKQYSNISTNIVFKERELDSFIIRLAQRSGKHISVAEPLIDATMPDGSRIQMTLSTHVTAHGGTFTIRKFSDVPLTPIDLINWGTFDSETMAYLWLCIENNKSLIFAGGTASGKTSSLNAVALFIPRQAKVISLEDTRELKLPHPNWIPAITRDAFTADERGAIDMYELLRAALRQRPEYLLVGEVRGKEALTLFQAMSTGHTTFSTMHADSVASAIHRLENPPISVPRSMIQALNIISIQSQTYFKGKRVRRNMKLVEITDIDPQTRNIRTNDIFSWDSMGDTFQRVGESKALKEIMIRRGMSQQEMGRELKYRQKILDFLVKNNISDYNAVSTIIYEYSVNSERVLKKLKIID